MKSGTASPISGDETERDIPLSGRAFCSAEGADRPVDAQCNMRVAHRHNVRKGSRADVKRDLELCRLNTQERSRLWPLIYVRS